MVEVEAGVEAGEGGCTGSEVGPVVLHIHHLQLGRPVVRPVVFHMYLWVGTQGHCILKQQVPRQGEPGVCHNYQEQALPRPQDHVQHGAHVQHGGHGHVLLRLVPPQISAESADFLRQSGRQPPPPHSPSLSYPEPHSASPPQTALGCPQPLQHYQPPVRRL